jgi:hypothetical protein
MTTRPAQFALIIAAMTAITSPALAAGDDTRPLLWDKVRSGMSVDEVRKLYPADGITIKWHADTQTEIEGVVILEGCKAEVEIQHPAGAVEVVKVKGKGSIGGRCSDKVFSALSAKYGQPDGRTEQSGSMMRRPKSTSVWSREGVTMRFAWMNDNGGGGGGLLQSSWEMEYRASASQIAL